MYSSQPISRFTSLLLCLLYSSISFSQQDRPNIIFIMTDDMGYADLSCYGRKDYTTPHIDKLASQSLKFVNAYAGAPVCTPTRTSFMTGRYPARTPVGLYEPLRGTPADTGMGLTPDYPSIATLLKNAGYATVLVGKWHLGFSTRNSPIANGFSEFFGFRSGATDYISHTNMRGIPDLFENDQPVKKEGYITNLISDRAVEFISKDHSKPFFLSVQFNGPHWPWQLPGDAPYPDTMNWRNGGSPAIYAGMMKSLDLAVGRIIDAVDSAGLAQNTIIIFTNDNGGEVFSDMGIFSGYKMGLWEGGIKVPALVRWPGKIDPGTTQQAVITMDWSATILAIAGSDPHPSFPLDGDNILPVCTGKKDTYDRTFFWRVTQVNDHKAIRDGKWKYLNTGEKEFLFDLLNDPSEQKDLAAQFPGVLQTLKNKYEDWEKKMLSPVPL